VDRLLLDLEIDALCWEFLVRRIIAQGGAHPPQPIVELLDSQPDNEPDFREAS